MALDCCNRALSVILPNTEPMLYLKGRALGIKGFVLYNMGHLDAAAAPLAEALVLFRRLGKRRNESQVSSNLALLAQSRGEIVEAIDFLESAMRTDAELRDVSSRGQKLAALGAIRLDLGDFETAKKNLTDGQAICRENQEPFGEIEADLGLAELLLANGDATKAREILENVGKREHVARNRIILVRHRQACAKAFLKCGLLEPARRLAEEAARIALEAGMNGEAVHCRVLQGLILAETEYMGEALLVTRRATDLLSSLERVRRAEEVWWLQALTLNKIGNPYRAEKALLEARKEVNRKLGMISDPKLAKLYESGPLVQSIRTGLG
jgi:tetratricopeptide (TPR) repeat protein